LFETLPNPSLYNGRFCHTPTTVYLTLDLTYLVEQQSRSNGVGRRNEGSNTEPNSSTTD